MFAVCALIMNTPLAGRGRLSGPPGPSCILICPIPHRPLGLTDPLCWSGTLTSYLKTPICIYTELFSDAYSIQHAPRRAPYPRSSLPQA